MFLHYSQDSKFHEAIPCGNCGKLIEPGSNVGVSYGNNRTEIVLFHAEEANCIPIGNFFDGFWGKDGTISFYDKVEKC
ncbi:MAG: hypothetical protein HQK84_05845 [Nitrospinae bacterium]|nr:hypothetical protein [Nitrospinota bacterium]